jgi:hypothetical protein
MSNTKKNKKEDTEKVTFSPNAVAKHMFEEKYGTVENKKSRLATKRSQNKAGKGGMMSKGKYKVKIVDGVKYMVLK